MARDILDEFAADQRRKPSYPDVVVEIGPGRGESLAALASAHPELNIVAFEVFEPAVASTLSRLAREGVSRMAEELSR